MKTNRKTFVTLLLATFVAVSGTMAKGPLFRWTILVVDAAGKPVQGALTTLADESDAGHAASEAAHTRVRGSTDTQGKFTGEIETADPQRVYFSVERNGYMPKKLSPTGKPMVQNGRWEPWAQTVKVVLIRIPSADPDNDPNKEPPSFPTGLRVTRATTNSIALKWNAPKVNRKISGYVIYRDGQPVETKEPIRGTTFTDTNLPDGEEFEYNVRAFDFSGNLSHLSDPVMGKTLPGQADGAAPKQATQSIPWDRPENWEGKIPGKKTTPK